MIEVNLLADRTNGRAPGSRIRQLSPVRSLDGWLLASLLVVVAAAACCALMFLSVRGKAAAADGTVAAAAGDSVERAVAARELAALESRRDEVLARVGVIRELDRRRYRWPRLLREVAEALPDRAWLTRVEQAGSEEGAPLRFRVEGETTDNLTLTLFMHRMEESGFIRGVRLVSAEQGFGRAGTSELPVYRFVIEADHEEAAAGAAAPTPIRPAGP